MNVPRRASWVVLLAVVAVSLFLGTRAEAPPSNLQRVQNISESIRCPECQGQSVSDSEAAIAAQIRAGIAQRVDAGETDEQIYDFYRGRFGDDVLLNPDATGVTGLVWVLPVIVVALGAAGVGFALSRGSFASGNGVKATAADRELVAAAQGTGGEGAGEQTTPSSSS